MDEIREQLETAIQAMKRVRNHYECDVTSYVSQPESPLSNPINMIIGVNDGLVLLERALLGVCQDARDSDDTP